MSSHQSIFNEYPSLACVPNNTLILSQKMEEESLKWQPRCLALLCGMEPVTPKRRYRSVFLKMPVVGSQRCRIPGLQQQESCADRCPLPAFWNGPSRHICGTSPEQSQTSSEDQNMESDWKRCGLEEHQHKSIWWRFMKYIHYLLTCWSLDVHRACKVGGGHTVSQHPCMIPIHCWVAV